MESTALAIIAGVCVCLALVFAFAALKIGDRTAGQQVLLRVTRDSGRIKVVDDQDAPGKRLLVPIRNLLLRIGKKLTPQGQAHILDQRLEHAGYPVGWDLNRLLVYKAAGLFVGPLFALFLPLRGIPVLGGLIDFILITFPAPFLILMLIGSAVAGFFVPDLILNSKAKKRTAETGRALADTVDMLKLTLEAGISFDSALRLVAQNTKGPLADEFSRVGQQITMGKSRSEALRSLADRTGDVDLSRFCKTCIQAEKRGTPFGEILSTQTREIRIKRRQLAEEQAQKVPVKILFPMMMCVLPTLFIIVMAPAVSQIVLGFDMQSGG